MSVDVKAGVAQESESVSSREGYIVELIGEVRVLIDHLPSSCKWVQEGEAPCQTVSRYPDPTQTLDP